MGVYKPLRCPYCGSTDCDQYENFGGYGETYEEQYVCCECEEQFRLVYEYKEIVKDG